MKNKNIALPLYIKLIIFFSDWFVIMGFVFSLPLIIIFGLDIELAERMNSNLILTFIPVILLLSAGLFRTIRRIEIIEDSTTIQRAVKVGEIVLFESNKSHGQRTIFRLTLEIRNGSNSMNLTKHYYFLNSSIAKNKYDYSFIFNQDKPEKVVLINLLPKLVKKYIMKIESTIANML